MSGYSIDFNAPGYLWFLLVLPLVWYWGRGGIAGLGRWRGLLATVVRTVIILIIVGALAEAHIVRRTERTAVFYLVDGSLSISPESAAAAVEFVNSSRNDRLARRGDLAGVISFGREAAIEIPLLGENLPWNGFEAPLDPQHTNLEAALRLALAAFPADCARRVVIVSDGNETLGDAIEAARRLNAEGVGIDVAPIDVARASEVLVERVNAPSHARAGAPIDVHVVLDHQVVGGEDTPIQGKLLVSRVAGQTRQTIVDQRVELAPGKRVFTFRDQVDRPELLTYEARFTADDPARDAFAQNNQATAFVHVRGRGRVLLIEEKGKEDEFDEYVQTLAKAEIEVVRAPSRDPFVGLADLQQYDAVILADVPRTSGETAADVMKFPDDKLEMLVRNTQQLGCGLIMLGGPDSFGAGGWNNTPLEAAMPVDFHVDGLKVVPTGALALVIDRSGSMAGDKITMSKAAAIEAFRVLGPQDFAGVWAFDTDAYTVVPFARVASLNAAARRISMLEAGGGTNMQPAVLRGYEALRRANAAAKHMIILSDGQTAGDGYTNLAADAARENITTTTVAVGTDANNAVMRDMARAGGGKFYQVHNPSALPRIFMREARRVARPVVYEDPNGIAPRIAYPHEMLAGIEQAPPITGYVMTTVKSNALVELGMVADKPGPTANAILASWTYGLGRTVAFTTDVGQRWAKDWVDWSGRDKLLVQMARWAMRPTTDAGKFNVATDLEDGRARIVVTALDAEDRFLNFLRLKAVAIGPDMKTHDVELRQTAPGRYIGDFPATDSGSYFVSISPGAGYSPIRMGVTVPYSREFVATHANHSLLERLALSAPEGGEPGEIIDVAAAVEETQTARPNVFRGGLEFPKQRSPIWPMLLFAASFIFVADVFNRRVAIGYGWIGAIKERVARWRHAQSAEVQAAREGLARLRSRKREVAEQIESRRQSVRFEPDPQHVEELSTPVARAASLDRPTPSTTTENNLAPDSQDADYTQRLLRAKNRVWKDKDRSE